MTQVYPGKENKNSLDAGFSAAFGTAAQRYFSAPGRTEIGGNHTDHQRGRVLAAAVNLDMRAAVRENGSNIIRLVSDKFSSCEIKLDELWPVDAEKNTAAALVRGMACGFEKAGASLRGLDIYCESDVMPGSGLSSSAAFELLLGTVFNNMFFDSRLGAEQLALMGQWTENNFFGKPCGLMDQMACAVGGLVSIDFYNKEAPLVKALDFDFAQSGHALCIIDTRASHTRLNHEYAAITEELKSVSRFFGKEVLSQIDESAFYTAIPLLRHSCGDRAVLRAMHFFEENARVPKQAEALESGNFEAFLGLVKESGRSSWTYLQNINPAGAVEHQPMALALALCEKLLRGRGASRVHGGGFAGTVQAFVPLDMLDEFKAGMDAVFGLGACRAMSIRSAGGMEYT